MKKNRWRLFFWGIAAAFILLPLIAMRFTDEVKWNFADFIFAGALVGSAGIACELAVRKMRDTAYRTACAIALAGVFILIWANLAVGINGNEENPANLMYWGVPAIGIAGAAVARFRPHGMMRALIATAIAQILVGLIAFGAGQGFAGPVTVFFVAIWLTSAWLFRKAAQDK